MTGFRRTVTIVGADADQAELGEARIRIEHEAIVKPQRRGRLKPVAQRSSACVGDFAMNDARIGLEQLIVLARPDEYDFGRRVAALGGVEQDASDGDIGTQRDSRKHVNAICGRP